MAVCMACGFFLSSSFTRTQSDADFWIEGLGRLWLGLARCAVRGRGAGVRDWRRNFLFDRSGGGSRLCTQRPAGELENNKDEGRQARHPRDDCPRTIASYFLAALAAALLINCHGWDLAVSASVPTAGLIDHKTDALEVYALRPCATNGPRPPARMTRFGGISQCGAGAILAAA